MIHSTPDHTENNEVIYDWFSLPFDVRRLIMNEIDDETKIQFIMASDDFVDDMPRNLINEVILDGSDLCVVINPSDEFSHFLLEKHTDGKFDESLIHYFDMFLKKFDRMEGVQVNSYFRDPSPSTVQEIQKFFNTRTVNHLTKLNSLVVQFNAQIDIFDSGFIAFDKFRNLSNVLRINCVALSIDQFKQLKAKYITYHNENITTEYVKECVKHALSPETDQNVEEIRLHNPKQNLNWDEITDEFCKVYLSEPTETFESHYNYSKFVLINAFGDDRCVLCRTSLSGVFEMLRVSMEENVE